MVQWEAENGHLAASPHKLGKEQLGLTNKSRVGKHRARTVHLMAETFFLRHVTICILYI